MLGSGIGLILSLFDVITADVRKITNMGIKLLMWTTPIIYGGSDLNPYLKIVNDYNPLTYMICSIRDIVLYGRIYGDLEFYYCFAAAIVVFLGAWRIFYVSEQQLVERMI
jgi:ABC-type polysaccharide/polyol phosphate export permease